MIHTGRWFVACVGVLLFLFGPLVAHAQAPPTVFISEVAWAGSSLSTSDEWFELANTSDEPVDLSGWSVDGAGTSNSTLTLPEGSIIEPHDVFLISNYDAGNAKSVLASAPAYVTTAVALSNANLLLTLRDVDGNVIDVAGDGGAPPAGLANSSGDVSMERVDPTVDGALPDAWTSATQSLGFVSDVSDLGSPGSYVFAVPDAAPLPDAAPESVPDTNLASAPVPDEPIEAAPLDEPVPTLESPDPAADVNADNASPQTEPVLAVADPDPSSADANAETTDESTMATASSTAVSSDEPVVTDTPVPATAPASPSAVIVAAVAQPAPAVAVSVIYPPQTLVINEFVSDPVKGNQEWVEVADLNNTVIPLDGWKVQESGGRTLSLPSQLLGMGQMVVVSFSSGALNNDGDTITLLDPSGGVNDVVTYGGDGAPATSDPNSVARDETGTFVVTTTPTPDEPNIITPIAVPVSSTAAQAVSTPVTAAAATPVPAQPAPPAVAPSAGTIASPVVSSLAATVVPPPSDAGLVLSELYANTTGSDAQEEFIEVENRSDHPLDLSGIALADASGKPSKLATDRTLDPGHELAISRSEFVFALNNTGGETVFLYGPDGSLLDRTSYETAPKGFSFSRIGDVWSWSATLTPNEPNVISTDAPPTASAVVAPVHVASATTHAAKPILDLTLDQVRQTPVDTLVRTSGVVVALPGTFGSQIMYLNGMQLYQSAGDFPDLALGDKVTLSGTVSTNRGESRIKLGKTDVLAVTDEGDAPEPVDATTVGEVNEGLLVRAEGVVIDKQSDRFTLQTPGDAILVRAKDAAGLSLKDISPGTHLVVTGVVSQVDAAYAVLPRSMDDLTFLQPPAAEPPPTVVSTGKASSSQSRTAIGTILALGTIVTLLALYIRHRFFTHTLPEPSSYEIHELPLPDPT